jgi:hypothetical protein
MPYYKGLIHSRWDRKYHVVIIPKKRKSHLWTVTKIFGRNTAYETHHQIPAIKCKVLEFAPIKRVAFFPQTYYCVLRFLIQITS